jgi:hypothetical protein
LAFSLVSEVIAAPPLTETKLQCNLEINNEYFSKISAETTRETRRENALVTIGESGKTLIMIVEGTEPLVSVGTTNAPTVKSHVNQSTDLVWQLTNEISQGGGVEGSNEVKIDRNTGLLTISQNRFSPRSIMKTTGSGYCSRVDITKKKF